MSIYEYSTIYVTDARSLQQLIVNSASVFLMIRCILSGFAKSLNACNNLAAGLTNRSPLHHRISVIYLIFSCSFTTVFKKKSLSSQLGFCGIGGTLCTLADPFNLH